MLETAVRRRWSIDTDKAAKTVNEALSSEDERIRMRAAGIAAVMEGQNQRDEQHFDSVNMDERRNRILALLGRTGPNQGPLVIEQSGSGVISGSDPDTPSDKPSRKAQRRKPKRKA
jgi:hypothetical protein